MKRIFIYAISTILSFIAFAQPKGMPQPLSTYELADEVRVKLNLDHSQFEKVYSAYEKYNKSVFGDQYSGMNMPAHPAGGRPGVRGNHPSGAMPEGGPGFGSGQPGRHPDINGQHPGKPDNHDFNINNKGHKPEDLQIMEKKRTKQEEKLVKSMQKIFKKDPSAFSRWQTIRKEQLKRLFQMPPASEEHHPNKYPK